MVVQQVLFGTLFFSYASPSPPGVHRSSCSNFQSITNFRIPDNVVCGTKLVGIIGLDLDEIRVIFNLVNMMSRQSLVPLYNSSTLSLALMAKKMK